jgi:hypothetical protein
VECTPSGTLMGTAARSLFAAKQQEKSLFNEVKEGSSK